MNILAAGGWEVITILESTVLKEAGARTMWIIISKRIASEEKVIEV